MFLLNKLASLVDAIAISEIWKHYPLTDWKISKKPPKGIDFYERELIKIPHELVYPPLLGKREVLNRKLNFQMEDRISQEFSSKHFNHIIVLIIITLINLELIIFSILTIDSLTILMISNSDYHCYNSMTIIMISSGDNWSAIAVVASTLDVDPRVTVLCARLHHLVIMV